MKFNGTAVIAESKGVKRTESIAVKVVSKKGRYATVGDIIVAAVKGELSTKRKLLTLKKGISEKSIEVTASVRMYPVSNSVDEAIEKYEREFYTKKSYSELQFDINSAFAKTVMVADGSK